MGNEQLDALIELGRPVAVTEPVPMEVLADARDNPSESELRSLLLGFEFLPFEAVSDFERGGADLASLLNVWEWRPALGS